MEYVVSNLNKKKRYLDSFGPFVTCLIFYLLYLYNKPPLPHFPAFSCIHVTLILPSPKPVAQCVSPLFFCCHAIFIYTLMMHLFILSSETKLTAHHNSRSPPRRVTTVLQSTERNTSKETVATKILPAAHA
jgi:hypothetical protein